MSPPVVTRTLTAAALAAGLAAKAAASVRGPSPTGRCRPFQSGFEYSIRKRLESHTFGRAEAFKYAQGRKVGHASAGSRADESGNRRRFGAGRERAAARCATADLSGNLEEEQAVGVCGVGVDGDESARAEACRTGRPV